ncbi:DUF6683 family protein [Sphingomonas sp. Sphisp140]|uniref:DUF6683 family protein n=1 Tax=unclassified Sphingomonas TaxID=196159 RepID=UPI0039AFD965
MKHIMGLALGVTLLGATPARAQVVDGWGWTIVTPSIARTDILGMHLADLEKRRGGATTRALPPRARRIAVPVSAFAYRPSADVRKASLDAMLIKARKGDPAGARSLEQLMAQGDIIERMGQLLAPVKLRTDNLADAYALWWIVMWNASQGKSADPDPVVCTAVRNQVVALLPGQAKLDDADKQRLAEGLLLQAMLVEAAIDQAKAPSEKAQVAALVRRTVAPMGLDFTAMTLTGKGFVAQ